MEAIEMNEDAFEDWIDSVATGGSTMSQRNLKWVEANGGVDKLVDTASRRGVHLVQLTDDKGNDLLAASQEPFKTLC